MSPAPSAGGSKPSQPPDPSQPKPAPPSQPGELPSWEEVKSSHPEGATNPPHPVLNVAPDRKRCFKTYEGGMTTPRDVFELPSGEARYFARYLDAGAAKGKEVRCPEGVAAALEARGADGDPGAAPASS